MRDPLVRVAKREANVTRVEEVSGHAADLAPGVVREASLIHEAGEDFEGEDHFVAHRGDEASEAHDAAGGVEVGEDEGVVGAGRSEESLKGVAGDWEVGGEVGCEWVVG